MNTYILHYTFLGKRWKTEVAANCIDDAVKQVEDSLNVYMVSIPAGKKRSFIDYLFELFATTKTQTP